MAHVEDLAKYDHLSALDAVIAAWNNGGAHPYWHAFAQKVVRDAMPNLARALDRLVSIDLER